MIPPIRFTVCWGLALGLVAGATEPTVVRQIESRGGLESRPFVLFLGAELQVKDESGWHLVTAANRGDFIVSDDGQEHRIEMDRPGFEFTWERRLKVSAKDAALTNLEIEAGYSPQRDPGRRWLESQSMAAVGAMDQERSANLRAGAEVSVGRSLSAVANNSNFSPEQKAQNSSEILGSTATLTAVDDSIPNLELGQQVEVGSEEDGFRKSRQKQNVNEGHDALDFSFQLIAQTSLAEPTLLIYVEFSVPGEVKQFRRTFGEKLPALAAGERANVHFSKAGFPVGYKLDHVRLHLFDEGREVALPNSDRRTPLTPEEAFQFIMIDHVSRGRDEAITAASTLIHELISAELRSAWKVQGRNCFVRVSRDGLAVGAYEDRAGERLLTNALQIQMVEQLRFRPALENGETVEAWCLLEREL